MIIIRIALSLLFTTSFIAFPQNFSSSVDADGNLSVRNLDAKSDADTLKAQFKITYGNETFYKEVNIIGSKFCTANFPNDFIRTGLEVEKPDFHFAATWSLIVNDELQFSKFVALSFQKAGKLKEATTFISDVGEEGGNLAQIINKSEIDASIREIQWFKDAAGFHYLIQAQDEDQLYFKHILHRPDLSKKVLSEHTEELEYCHDAELGFPKLEIEDLNSDGICEVSYLIIRNCESGEKLKENMYLFMFENNAIYMIKGQQFTSRGGGKYKFYGTSFPENSGVYKAYTTDLWNSMGAKQ